jgi:hypothetical protein
MGMHYTGDWPSVSPTTDVLALALVMGDRTRQIWAGKIVDQQPTIEGTRGEQLYRIYVDQFEYIGTHDLSLVSDAAFYDTNGGGGSRVKVVSARAGRRSKNTKEASPGEMVQKLVWIRKNHRHFKDPVWLHWGGKCSVTRDACNGMLVASHIKPWSESSPREKTDVNNGLLLASPLDALFDRGLIGFSDDGHMLTSERLSSKTKTIFRVDSRLQLDKSRITKKMKGYLDWHRKEFKLSN